MSGSVANGTGSEVAVMAGVALAHRAWLEIGGPEAEPFLQRLVTADLDALERGVAAPCALLSPQGKVLHEFLIMRASNDTARGPDDDAAAGEASGFRIDVSRAFLPDLARRLMMYRLHAPVTFTPRPGGAVRAAWDEDAPYRDARFSSGVGRLYPAEGGVAGAPLLGEWTRRRIAGGVAEIGTDYPADTYFPHDLGLAGDGATGTTRGVGLHKGCYVGQEVVSRMHHRGTGRRRVAILHADGPFPKPGTPVEAGGRPCGTLGSSTGDAPFLALAVVRIDRAGEALAAGDRVTVAGLPVTPRVPPGAGWSFHTEPRSPDREPGADSANAPADGVSAPADGVPSAPSPSP